ncbi:unnamed protein product, partial [Ixodes hexagonus]
LQQRGHFLLQNGSQSLDLKVAGLAPGNYCAMVTWPDGNATSERPVWVWPSSGGPQAAGCSDWSATIVVTASYTASRVEAEVHMHDWPQCHGEFLVGLWQPDVAPGDGERVCDGNKILFHSEQPHSLQENGSNIVVFENLTAGNYCVRVTPKCPGRHDCTTLYSKVVELPGKRSHVFTARKLVTHSVFFFFFLMTSPMVTRRHLLKRGKRKTTKMTNQKMAASAATCQLYKSLHSLVKVVYSRDCEAHNEAVWRLCALLRSGLGVGVEYDEGALGRAHLSAEWALAMADVACPLYPRDDAQAPARPEKLLFVESEGGLIKQQAYRKGKDVGLCSETLWDDLYHTTYTALLSRQAQALGDYCHILVAGFRDTPPSARLDLVPQKRYVLPSHMRDLLAALLHGWMRDEDVEARVQNALASDAHARFQEALSNVRNSLEENPDLVRDRLRAIVDS